MTNPQPPSPGSDPPEGEARGGQTPLRVRRANSRDAAGIAWVWVRAWQTSYRGLVPDEYLDALSVDDRLGRWQARLEAGDCTFVIEEYGIAGYCRIVRPDQIASLYVLPERRHGGLGRALLSAALEELGPHSDDVWLWVFKANHAARAFYATFGFAPDGAEGIDPGTGITEIRMRRKP
jgi:ribosomal protein S18 acetylase RimI-like enzyme